MFVTYITIFLFWPKRTVAKLRFFFSNTREEIVDYPNSIKSPLGCSRVLFNRIHHLHLPLEYTFCHAPPKDPSHSCTISDRGQIKFVTTPAQEWTKVQGSGAKTPHQYLTKVKNKFKKSLKIMRINVFLRLHIPPIFLLHNHPL